MTTQQIDIIHATRPEAEIARSGSCRTATTCCQRHARAGVAACLLQR